MVHYCLTTNIKKNLHYNNKVQFVATVSFVHSDSDAIRIFRICIPKTKIHYYKTDNLEIVIG